MENNQQQKSKDTTQSDKTNKHESTNINTPQEASEEFMGTTVENPASQSEAGPDIYDIGMGGPGASSSGLSDRNENEQIDEE